MSRWGCRLLKGVDGGRADPKAEDELSLRCPQDIQVEVPSKKLHNQVYSSEEMSKDINLRTPER